MSKQFSLPVLTLPDVVFFPHTVLPMNIQDKVCIQMVNDTLIYNSPIAIAKGPAFQDGQNFRPHAQPQEICTAGLPYILEEDSSDSHLKLILKGEMRIRLIQCLQELPYPVYLAENIPLSKEQTLLEGAQTTHLKNLIEMWLEKYIHNSMEREQFKLHIDSTDRLVNNVCMLMLKDPEVKQFLLEKNLLSERIQLLNTLFPTLNSLEEDFLVSHAMKHYHSLQYKNHIPN